MPAKIRITDGEPIELYAQDEKTNPAYIKKLSTKLVLGSTGGIQLDASSLTMISPATITAVGTLNIGTSGDIVNLNISGVTYNLGTINGDITFNGNVNIPTGYISFNSGVTTGTAGIASSDYGKIYGEHDSGTETSRLVIDIGDNTTDSIVFRTHNGTTAQDTVKVAYNAVTFAVTPNVNGTNLSLDHTHPYLNTSGGTLTGDLTIQKNDARLIFNRPSSQTGQYGGIRFADNSTNKGGIYWDYTNNRLVASEDGSTYNRIWTAGNDGPGSTLDSDTVDGYHASSIFLLNSGTAVVGGSSNTYPISVKDSSNTEIIKLDNTGITVNSGKATIYNTSGKTVIDENGINPDGINSGTISLSSIKIGNTNTEINGYNKNISVKVNDIEAVTLGRYEYDTGIQDATFTRDSIAYLSDGTSVSSNQPRYEQNGFTTQTPALPDYPVLPLQSNLTDLVSDLNMTYSRNSTAYNLDYSTANTNIPRYWPLGTKGA